MTDAFERWSDPPEPRAPRAAFARELRRRLLAGLDLRPTDLTIDPATGSRTMTSTQSPTSTPITPYLAVSDAAAAIDFYRDVLDATEDFRVVGDDGRVGHAELSLPGGGRLMLADEYPDFGAVAPTTVGGTPVTLYLEVDDCDRVHAAAVAAGATSERGPADQTHGNRTATIVDPFGHRWMLSQSVEDLDLASYARRQRAEGGFDVRPGTDDPDSDARPDEVISGSATGTDAPEAADIHVWAALTFADARAAVALLADVFGFERRLIVEAEDDPTVITHAELRWPEGGGVMLGSAGRHHDEFSARPTGAASMYLVSDRQRVDGLWQRCVDAGLEVVAALHDDDYGEGYANHGFSVRDPEGNIWTLGTYPGA